MKTSLALSAILVLAPSLARAEEPVPHEGRAVLLAQADAASQRAARSTSEASPGAPPAREPGGAPQQPSLQQATPPPGQWVYTEQYGWVYMPYGDAYAYAPESETADPYMYVYYPAVGWTWVDAPWLWGWGPWPYFGVHGPWRFAWFGHGPRFFGFHRFGGVHGFAPAPLRGVGRPGFVPRGGFGGHAVGGHAGGGHSRR